MTRLNVGGPARHVLFLADGMRESWETVLACGIPEPGEGEMDGLARELGVLPLRLPRLGRSVRPLDDLLAFLSLWRLCRRLKPDLVHTHTSKAGALGRLAARLAGVSVVLHTFHGHVFRGHFGPWTSRMIVLAERLLALLTTRIYAVSPTQMDDLISLRVAPAEKIRVLPLGLDLSPLAPPLPRGALRRGLGIPEDAAVLGCVARLVPVKAHADLIEAFSRLKALDVHLVLVGDGELGGSLESRVRQKGLEDRIHFTGWRQDLREVYGDMDLAVLASLSEGSPVTLIEAASAGVPIVATRVGGVSDLLEGHPATRLVPPSDPAGLAHALEESLHDLPGLRERAREASPVWRSRYDRGRLATDLTREYAGLVRP